MAKIFTRLFHVVVYTLSFLGGGFLGLYFLLGGFHGLLSGTPIPLWSIDSLENPQQVVEIREDTLVLEDGTEVRLPQIKTVPTENTLFRKALERGVEVAPDGEVTGLLSVHNDICSPDLTLYRIERVNLSDLTVAIDPSAIEEDILNPASIEQLESTSFVLDEPERIRASDLLKMRRIRHLFGVPQGKN